MFSPNTYPKLSGHDSYRVCYSSEVLEAVKIKCTNNLQQWQTMIEKVSLKQFQYFNSQTHHVRVTGIRVRRKEVIKVMYGWFKIFLFNETGIHSS